MVMVQQEEEDAALKPPPPPPAPAAVVLAWDLAALTKKSAAAAGARVTDSKQPQPQPGIPSLKKKPAPPARLLSVPPPPGRAAAARSLSSRARAVRPEDDPFLAAYLACTKSAARNENAKKSRGGSGRRFTWAALGLSCKSSSGAVEQSMVKVARRPELDPRDD